jgi:hypothetical protein
MLLKVIAGLLVAVAVVLTGAALTGHCPFSSHCCGTATDQPVSETDCCTPTSDCCTTSSDCCTAETAVKKIDCCEATKVAGEDKDK